MFLLLAIACAPHVATLETPAAVGDAPPTHRVHRNARPGSAAELENAALAAEQVGDLSEAVALAREAYVAEPARRRHRYVLELEARLDAHGGAAAIP